MYRRLLVLSLFPLGFHMHNDHHADLDSLLKDVPAFNRRFASTVLEVGDDHWPDYAVTGMELRGARFSGTEFSGSRISQSKFSDCRFQDVAFTAAELQDVEFDRCRFEHCVFTAAKVSNCRFRGGDFSETVLQFEKDSPHWTIVENSKFDSVRFAGLHLNKANFSNSFFQKDTFEDIDYEDALFSKCSFQAPRFAGKDFSNVQFTECLLEHPVYQGPKLQKAAYAKTVIIGVQLAPESNWSERNFGVLGVVFKNSTFDLSKLRGNFGLNGGEDCTIENFDSEGSFGLSGVYTRVMIKNIRARRLDLDHGTVCKQVRFEEVEARDVYLDKSQFTDCMFRNFTAGKFMRADSATFENVRWENAKLGAGAVFSAKGTIYEQHPPF